MESTIIRREDRFKPCYKWNTFNTFVPVYMEDDGAVVLNLVINGIPSIRMDYDTWSEKVINEF